MKRRVHGGGRSRRARGGLSVFVVMALLTVTGCSTSRDPDDAAPTKADAGEADIEAAQKKFCADNDRYGTEDELVEEGLLDKESTTFDIVLVAAGPCGESEQSGFVVGFEKANGGSPPQIDTLTLAARGGNGYPNPFGWVRGPGHLNANYIFDPLLWRDATGEPIPWLAETVPTVDNGGVSEDGKTYTFKLRSGVEWHDGKPFTADDVKFTFDYLKSGPGAAGPCFCKSGFQQIESVTVKSPTEVEFKLLRPFNTFVANIAQAMIIIPKHIWEPITDPLNQHTNAAAYVGTGPYKLVDPTSYDPSTGVSQYEANTDFFLGVPYVRKLQFVSTGNDPVAALVTGTVDAGDIGNEESVTDAALGPVADLPRVTNPGGWTRALHFNLTKGFPYDDAKFRQAVAYAVDREALLQNIVGGRGEVGSMGFLAPSHPMLAPDLPTYDHDLEKAGALLDAIGIKDTDNDGKRELPTSPGTNFTPVIHSSNRFSDDTVNAMIEYLGDVGIAATRNTEDATTSDARAKGGNYEMMVIGWGNVTADADMLRTRLSDAFTSKPQGKQFTSIYGWNNTENAKRFMELADAQFVEPDPKERKKQLHEMQRLVAEDVPIMELYVPDTMLFYQPDSLKAWYSTPGGTPPGPPGFLNKHVLVTGKQFGSTARA